MGAFGKLKGYVQVLIVAAVCGGLLGLVWYVFMSPMQVTIADQTKKLADLQEKVDKSLKQKAVFEQFKQESEALEAKLEDLKKVLPQDRETDQILKQVQSSASGSGLKIQSGVSKSPVDHEVYTEYPLEMEVLGTYHSLGEFLEKIRRLDRIVNIDKLRIQSRASEGQSASTGSIGADYEAKTYVYRDEILDKAPAAKAVKVKKMKGRHFTILAIALLALSGCAEDKAAGDKAAASVKAAAAAPKDPAAAQSKGAKAKTATKGQVEDDAPPVLSVPEGFRYEPRGRRDPFVNPVPKPPAPPPEIPVIRPDGLPGVLVSEVKIAGILTSKEAGMTRVILTAPGKKTYFAVQGETLFDGVIKEIRPSEVVFTMISPSTKQPVNRETIVMTGASAGTSAGEKK